jgi:hypothetical protein
MNKTDLQGYTIKFSKSTWRDIKIFLAMSSSLKYQYELFNTAVKFVYENNIALTPVANPLKGKHRTCYIDDNLGWTINNIANKINCNPSRALYTIILKYMELNTEMVPEINHLPEERLLQSEPNITG